MVRVIRWRCRSAPANDIVTTSSNGMGILGLELSSLWYVSVCVCVYAHVFVCVCVGVCIQFNFNYLSQFVRQHSVCGFLGKRKKEAKWVRWIILCDAALVECVCVSVCLCAVLEVSLSDTCTQRTHTHHI